MRFLRRGFFLGVTGLCLLGVAGCTEDNEKGSGILEQKGTAPANPGPPTNYAQRPPSGPEAFKGSGYPGADATAKNQAKTDEKAKDKAPEK